MHPKDICSITKREKQVSDSKEHFMCILFESSVFLLHQNSKKHFLRVYHGDNAVFFFKILRIHNFYIVLFQQIWKKRAKNVQKYLKETPLEYHFWKLGYNHSKKFPLTECFEKAFSELRWLPEEQILCNKSIGLTCHACKV